MGSSVTCHSCQARVAVVTAGATVRCDQCGSEIELRPASPDETPPPPRVEPTSDEPAITTARGTDEPVGDAGEDGAFEPVAPAVSERAPSDREPSLEPAEARSRMDASSLDDDWDLAPAPTRGAGSQNESEPRAATERHHDRPRSVPPAPLHRIGRYTVFEEFASGGMASVHFGRLYGAAGFSRIVAIKRLHPHLSKDPNFAEMFVTEARLAARIRHPNVVEILDVIADDRELALVMEYVRGESLVALVRSAAKRRETLPLDVAAGIMVGILQGLHAAHDARDERGQPLFIVHRDVSPHNVLVGADGIARVFDFGIAKPVEAAQDTDPGLLKGKASYMAPEQIHGAPLSRAVDIFAAGVVYWELLTGRKLFGGRDNAERLYKVLEGGYPRPSECQPSIPAALDEAVMRAMARHPEDRFPTALAFAEAVEHATRLASPRTIGNWVSAMASDVLAVQAELMTAVEALPPESATPIAARIAEEMLSTLPPPAAVPRLTPPSPAARRTPWLLALGGVAIGALLVVLVLRLGGSSEPMPSAVGVTASSLAETSSPSAAASRLAASTSLASDDAGPPAASASSRSRARLSAPRSPNPRDLRGFRPTEL